MDRRSLHYQQRYVYFSRYNTYNWYSDNPHITVKRMRQGQCGFNVWVGILSGRIMAPHILNASFKSERYLQIVQQYTDTLLNDMPQNKRKMICLQLDEAPSHNAAGVSNYLDQLFRDDWIGNRSYVHWPARSSDLTTLDIRYIQTRI